ncbi:MAG TPA: acetate--CoA ligase [Gemmatimonadales bacterium]|nr:acetate--CoA ligase [Gemmatimonadales bacterium]
MTDRIETLLDEQRTFPPPSGFKAQAQVRDDSIYKKAKTDREAYWADWAKQLEWIKPWNRVLEWKPPHAKWFLGGKLNASVNCLDRHVRSGKKDKVALIWEGEPGEVRRITYGDLLQDVCRCANALKALGVKKGDRVAIYMPMVPEVAVAMLACARLGAVHTVVFGGFSSESLRDRINDALAQVLITADGGYRRGGQVPLKQNADEAIAGTPSIQHVVVLKRTGQAVNMKAGRDQWWDPLVTSQSTECAPEPMDAEDPLYILYTSGTTGKPKGILHTTGGYLTHVFATTKWVFDLNDSDVFWCTADVGWVTGHSYVVYGPLAVGVTELMYEGAPDHPGKDRFWALCARHGVTVFYTAPTAIRSFMKWGTELPARHDLSKIRLLGSVGEPINPEAWMWYQEHIGGNRCPIVDTWWQTETGGIMITPLPGITTTKPGSGTVAFPGIDAVLLDGDGKEVKVGGGYLAITSPWPGMLRTIWGDDERYRSVYWSRWPDTYFPGDGAKRDDDGYFWILGRVDDVLNVAGHRIGTMEVESALVDHPAVAEAAVVGRTHDLKGQALAAFVTIKEGRQASDALREELKGHVAKKIGALARPDDIIYAADLPKTRSGKIMRRLLKDIAEGRALGDTTTLADPAVMQKLKVLYEDKEG